MQKIYYQGFIQPEDFSQDNIIIDEKNNSTFEDILPLDIRDGFYIQNIQWKDFQGQIQENSPWIAHTFWNIRYNYNLWIPRTNSPPRQNEKKQATVIIRNRSNNRLPLQREPSPSQKQQNISHTPPQQQNRSHSQRQQPNKQFRLSVSVQAHLSPKSWVRGDQSQLLLDHERGHYLLGCLCALEFKRRAENKLWQEDKTDSLKVQVGYLFRETLKQFLEIEQNYDIETGHYIDQEMQNYWNRMIKQQLLLYNSYFSR